MNNWFKKTMTFLITILTLGALTPPTYLDVSAESKNNNIILDESKEEEKEQDILNTELENNINRLYDEENLLFEEFDVDEYFIHLLTNQAKEEMKNKLGPKILDQVASEVEAIIVPNIEEVLYSILVEAGKEDAEYFGITSNSKFGEKIFKIYDERTNEEIARFDVRRNHRPKDGYWFNFHYHLSDDNFEEHYEIGEIYWDKNTPPKWKS